MRALVLLQLALAPLAQGQDNIRKLFPATPTGYVTDVASVIDRSSSAAMESKIQRLRDATGAEIAVVALPTIRDYSALEVAVAIGRDWGVGAATGVGDQRRNAGLVILLVPKRQEDPNSGQIFIATGRGLEGIITDATAGRVRDLMRPQLSAGEYGPGLTTGVDALAALIAEGFGVTDSTLAAGRAVYRRGAGQHPAFVVSPAVILLAIIIMVAVFRTLARSAAYGGRRRRRPRIFWGGPGWGGGFGGFGGGFGGGGFGGFGGGGGFSGGGAGGRF